MNNIVRQFVKINRFNSLTKSMFRNFAFTQVLPTFAESVSTGEITEIMVKSGQKIKEGDLVAVIDIEKSTVEL